MNFPTDNVSDPNGPLLSARSLAELAFSRAASAPLIGENALRLLRDGVENCAAWRDAIRSAKHAIFFENYIISPDGTGRSFRDELAKRAADGVKVRVLLDWFGSFSPPRSFWEPLIRAGVAMLAGLFFIFRALRSRAGRRRVRKAAQPA